MRKHACLEPSCALEFEQHRHGCWMQTPCGDVLVSIGHWTGVHWSLNWCSLVTGVPWSLVFIGHWCSLSERRLLAFVCMSVRSCLCRPNVDHLKLCTTFTNAEGGKLLGSNWLLMGNTVSTERANTHVTQFFAGHSLSSRIHDAMVVSSCSTQ